ncbi:MAG: hypothetical protein V4629_10185 [Pseudomonadota bacterium]
MPFSIEQAQSLRESQIGVTSSYFGLDSLTQNAGFSKSAALAALESSGGSAQAGVNWEEFNQAFDKLMQDDMFEIDPTGAIELTDNGAALVEQQKHIIPSLNIQQPLEPYFPNSTSEVTPLSLVSGSGVISADKTSGLTDEPIIGAGAGVGVGAGTGTNVIGQFYSSEYGNSGFTNYRHDNVKIDGGESITIFADDSSGGEARFDNIKDLKSFTYTVERSTVDSALHVGTFMYVDEPGSPFKGAEADYGEVLPDYGAKYWGRDETNFTSTFHDPGVSGENNISLKNIVSHTEYDSSLWGQKSPEDSKTMTFRYEFGKDDGKVDIFAKHLDTGQWVKVDSLQNKIAETTLEHGKLIFSAWSDSDGGSLGSGASVKFSDVMLDYHT